MWSDSPHRRWFRWLAGGLLLMGLLVVILLLFRSEVSVRTVTVSRQYPTDAMTTLVSSGYVTAQRKASVASKITSRLDWLGVEEGTPVQQGQVLALLEGADAEAALQRTIAEESAARAAVARAAAEAADATRNERRFAALDGAGVIARADYDAVVTRMTVATAVHKAALDALAAATASRHVAEINHEYTRIRAPFSGVVLTKNADVGDIVTPLGAAANAKASVVTIADLSSLLVESDVSESSVGKVRAGMPCEIVLDALPGERFAGRVHIIVPTADRSKASVLVKVRFDVLDPRVLPEMSSRVSFLDRVPESGERTARLAVSVDALLPASGASQVTTGGTTGPDGGERLADREVFVVREGRVQRVSVRLGARFGDVVEVLEGLTEGAKVVLTPPAGLRDGDRVRSGA